MAIKAIDTNTNIRREVKRTAAVGTDTQTVTDIYYQTSFVADEASDIADMNAEGSEYLNYPAGSAALCLGDGNVYILNASETEYEIPGGADE